MTRFDIAMVLLAVVAATVGVWVYQWVDVALFHWKIRRLKKRLDKACKDYWPFP